MQKIKTFLWFESGADEAVRLYTSLFEDSSTNSTDDVPAEGASETNTVRVIEFRMAGLDYVAMNAPGAPKPADATSFSVSCRDQVEVDRLWDALMEGGESLACGWLRDRWGFAWQITPARMFEMMATGNDAQRTAVMNAMMQMIKFDCAALEEAFASAG